MSEEPLAGKHRPTPKAKAAPAADPKRPYHVGVAIGLTTGLYAASLLVTARLQIAQDRDLIEDRTPVEVAISSLGDHHDWMTDRLEEARAQYAIGTTGYDALRVRLTTLDQQLAKLGQVVDGVEQLGARLPASLDLPGVPVTTRGSSGSGKSSGGQSSGGGSKPKPPPVVPGAPPPPPPPTGGTSGASGAP